MLYGISERLKWFLESDIEISLLKRCGRIQSQFEDFRALYIRVRCYRKTLVGEIGARRNRQVALHIVADIG
jgi:hypothetical protein